MHTRTQPSAPAHSPPAPLAWTRWRAWWNSLLRALPVAALAFFLAGCETPTNKIVGDEQLPFGSLRFTEGDVLKITFPGAPDLNAEQKIRLDGMIALSMVGEVRAAGLTPAELEKEILRRYGPQLETKQVTVTFSASTFPVFVTGAVVKPGKIVTDRPLTVLEAIMEAGGFTRTARTHHVVVIRNGGKNNKSYILDLGPLLKGKPQPSFYLHPSDVVNVPESAL